MLLWVRDYLTRAVESTPEVLNFLLRDLDAQSQAWDFRPHADRFTLREMVSHLADFESVIAERLQRTISEDEPFLPSWDEDKAVITGNYAERNAVEQLQTFTARRAQTVELVRRCSETDWDRIAERETLGHFPFSEQVTLILAHDSYHIRQTTQWLDTARAANLL